MVNKFFEYFAVRFIRTFIFVLCLCLHSVCSSVFLRIVFYSLETSRIDAISLSVCTRILLGLRSLLFVVSFSRLFVCIIRFLSRVNAINHARHTSAENKQIESIIFITHISTQVHVFDSYLCFKLDTPPLSLNRNI